MISLIHHLPTPIIHCLLLQLKLPVPLTNSHTIRHGAVISLTLPGVNLKKGPDAFTNITPTIRLNLAPRTMFEQSFHLRAIGRCALHRPARGRMQQQRHVQGNATLTLLPLFRRERTLLSSHRDGLQLMLMTGDGRVAQTVNALIKVGTGGTMVSLPLQNLAGADGTLLDKLGRVAIVQVPQYHHGRVLGPAERIELVVVALAEVQK
mmetsp:Transcript_9995/g.17981  ORF Transcript_9995/g.17981 Transcript_9995/m.17981 type:complete len:207 (+) Transcript_9995:161-781(+)